MSTYYQNEILEKKLKPFFCFDRMYASGFAKKYNSHPYFLSDIFASSGDFGSAARLKVPFLFEFFDFNPLQVYIFNECKIITPEFLCNFLYPPEEPDERLRETFVNLVSFFDYDMPAVKMASDGLSLEQLHVLLAAKEFSNTFHEAYSNITPLLFNVFYPAFECHSPSHAKETALTTDHEAKERFFKVVSAADRSRSLSETSGSPNSSRLDSVQVLESAVRIINLDLDRLLHSDDSSFIRDFSSLIENIDVSGNCLKKNFRLSDGTAVNKPGKHQLIDEGRSR